MVIKENIMIRDNIEANKFITPNSLDIEFLKINFA